MNIICQWPVFSVRYTVFFNKIKISVHHFCADTKFNIAPRYVIAVPVQFWIQILLCPTMCSGTRYDLENTGIFGTVPTCTDPISYLIPVQKWCTGTRCRRYMCCTTTEICTDRGPCYLFVVGVGYLVFVWKPTSCERVRSHT